MAQGLAFKLSIAVLATAATLLGARPAQALVVPIDEFTVTRNGDVFFSDSFSDSLEPPVGPSGANNYGIVGAISNTAEAGGRLLIDSSTGFLTQNALGEGRRFLGVTLLTDTNSSNLGPGLKSDDTLSASGTFDLVTPGGPLFSGYGVRFHDSVVNQVVQLFVRHNSVTGQAEVAYNQQDFVADTIDLLGSVALAPPVGADQITLTLTRPDVASDAFFASFTYLAGGVSVGTGGFQTGGLMFQGEEFVRAQFFTSEAIAVAIPEPETYALMMAGLGLLGLVARRRKAR